MARCCRDSAVPASGDVRMDAILSGYKQTGSTITYSFYEDSVFGGTYYGSETGPRGQRGGQTNVRAILAGYSPMKNLNSVEVPETSPASAPSGSWFRLRLATLTRTTRLVELQESDVHLAAVYDRAGDTNGFQIRRASTDMDAHHVGHALGLKHPHDGTPTMPALLDFNTSTVMSYQFLGESPGTLMPFDIMALQYLYGSRA